MPRMRDRSIHCEVCNGNCQVTANLDTGTLTKAVMAPACKFPQRCLREHTVGIFKRQFGSRILRHGDYV